MTTLLNQTEAQLRTALELPLHSPQRHWMVQAALRQFEVMVCLERQRELRQAVAIARTRCTD